jgi:4'-phosphopantetheinyl transferase
VPVLTAGECQVWWAAPSLRRSWHASLLDAGERERLQRLRRPADRDRFTVACALLRIVLGRVTGTAPSAVRVDRTCPDCDRPHGKPVPRDAPGLTCSVSHSGGRIAVAVARSVTVGVDVEAVDPALEVGALGRRVLAPGELADLEALPAARRAWALATTWTRKEAVLKATGHGLRVPPDQVQVTSPLRTPALVAVGDVPFAAGDVSLYPLAAGDGYAATLAAVAGRLRSVLQLDAAPLLA